MSYGQKKVDSFLYIVLCYLIALLISIFFIDLGEFSNLNNLDFIFYINFFIVISAMSIGTSIYIYVASKLGPIIVSTFIFTVPIISIISAKIFLNEKITINIIIGGILGIISVYLINRTEKEQFIN